MTYSAPGLGSRSIRFERNHNDLFAQSFYLVVKGFPKFGCDGVDRAAVRGVQQEGAEICNPTIQLTALPTMNDSLPQL